MSKPSTTVESIEFEPLQPVLSDAAIDAIAELLLSAGVRNGSENKRQLCASAQLEKQEKNKP